MFSFFSNPPLQFLFCTPPPPPYRWRLTGECSTIRPGDCLLLRRWMEALSASRMQLQLHQPPWWMEGREGGGDGGRYREGHLSCFLIYLSLYKPGGGCVCVCVCGGGGWGWRFTLTSGQTFISFLSVSLLYAEINSNRFSKTCHVFNDPPSLIHSCLFVCIWVCDCVCSYCMFSVCMVVIWCYCVCIIVC